MLRWRLLLGVLFVAALAALCWLDYAASPAGLWLYPLALGVAALGAGEMADLAARREPRARSGVIYLGTLLPVALCGVPMFLLEDPHGCPLGWLGWPLLGLTAALMVAFLAEMWHYDAPGAVLERLAKAFLAISYLGILLSFMLQLRAFGEGPTGMVALISMVAIVKMSDTGAYIAGRLMGRHKLAPRLSPGKTWEGVAGGVAFALLACYLVFAWWVPWLAVGDRSTTALGWGWIVYAVLVSLAGLLGDLAESLLKRDAGIKDSSDWMPGFGGVLDLIDSALAAAPVAYLCWVAGLVGME